MTVSGLNWGELNVWCFFGCMGSQRVKFMGPTWDPSGSGRTQMGPMLAPWTLLWGVMECKFEETPFRIVHADGSTSHMELILLLMFFVYIALVLYYIIDLLHTGPWQMFLVILCDIKYRFVSHFSLAIRLPMLIQQLSRYIHTHLTILYMFPTFLHMPTKY